MRASAGAAAALASTSSTPSALRRASSAFTSAFGDGAFCFFGEVGEASAFRLAGSAAALAGSVFTSSFGAGGGASAIARCARGMSSSESLELSGMPDYSETDLPRGNGMW